MRQIALITKCNIKIHMVIIQTLLTNPHPNPLIFFRGDEASHIDNISVKFVETILRQNVMLKYI